MKKSISLFVFLAGCYPGYTNVSASQLQPTAGNGVICLVRHDKLVGKYARFKHYDNEQLVGVSQRNGTVICYHAGAGEHHLVSYSDNASHMALDVAEGHIYYVEVVPKVGPDNMNLIASERTTPIRALPHVTTLRVGARYEPITRTPIPAFR